MATTVLYYFLSKKKRSHVASALGFGLCFLFFFSCKNNQAPKGLFQKLDKSQTGLDFRNLILEKETFNIFKYQYFYNGGGVAVGDFNNDGLEDLVFTGNMVKNRLYLNKGNLKFEDITKKSKIAEKEGWCTGVTTVDINQDGWLDLYICRAGYPFEKLTRNLLFINNGDLTFSEKAAEYGLDDPAHSTMAAFFDYDKDGDLDLFLANHSEVEYSRGSLEVFQLRAQKKPSITNKLYRNNSISKENVSETSNQKFTNVTEAAGIFSNVLSFSLGLNIADINGDNWPDIFIGNDFNEPDYLFINNQNGTFTDRLAEAFDHTAMFSMGADIADINNDGLLDIINLDMLPEGNYLQKMHSGADNFDKISALIKNGFFKQYSRNMLQINNGDGTFSECGQMAGVSNTDWSWSPLFLDFDNDGLKDLFISNGYLRDHTDMDFLRFTADEVQRINAGQENIGFEQYMTKMPPINQPNYFFKNIDGLRFENKTSAWSLDIPSVSQGSAYADFDQDGDLDLVTNMSNEDAGFFENLTNNQAGKPNNYLKIKLIGAKENPVGIGAKIWLWAKGKQFFQEQQPVRGFQSTVSPIQHFGLGALEKIDSLRILWPSGLSQKLENIKTNQSLELKEKDASETVFASYKKYRQPIFTKIKNPDLPKQNASQGSDFHTQFLLPYFYSDAGPALAVSDVNGDGRADFYYGCMGTVNALYISDGKGTYETKRLEAFRFLNAAADVDAAFLNKKNLLITSGAYNERKYQSTLITDVFNAPKTQDIKPSFDENNACIAASKTGDYFIGSSVKPEQFPLVGNSYFYKKNKKPQKIQHSGIIKDAIWADVLGDEKEELILATEWAPIQVFTLRNDTLQAVQGIFPEKTNGLYQSILAFDADKDGDLDLLAGNLGTNNQLYASADEPMQLYADDFDKNGSIDPILCRFYEGKSYPIASREDLLGQLKYLAKKFVSFDTYAKADIAQILNENQLKTSLVGEVYNLETALFLNNNDNFSLKKLPQEVQVAPVCASAALDVDGDGLMDLILAGNMSNARVKLGRLDGNHGQYLKGRGNGGFDFIPYVESGFQIRGDVRKIEIFKEKKGYTLFFGVHDGSLEIWKTN